MARHSTEVAVTQLSQQLWTDSQDLAESCLRHPFLRGLGDGTLSRERYSKFIAQDAYFLDVFARAYAAGVFRAPDHEGRRSWHELQSGVFEELKLHAATAADLGIDLTQVTPLDATQAYTDFLLANAITGTLGELAAAMAPCMRLYHFLGVRLAQEEGPPSNPYAHWIETYAASEMAQLVDKVEQLVDRYGEGTAAERGCYRRAMQLEHGFFDEAWRE